MKLDRSVLIEVVKNTLRVSIDLIMRKTQNEVLLVHHDITTTNRPEVISVCLVPGYVSLNFIY
ncbi:MAG: hypothetical protein HRF42_15140 [Candidatus Brocadia sp.]|jgi:hypothetical protein